MNIADLVPLFLVALSFLVTLLVLVRVMRHRSRPIVKTFIWSMIAVSWWLFCAIIENISNNYSLSVIWMKLSYLGVTAVPVIWMVFSFQYTDREKWITRGRMALLFLVPVITLLVVSTDSVHHLMWNSIALDTNTYPSSLKVSHGFWFWIHAAYSYTLLFVGSLNLLNLFLKKSGIFRRQMGLLLLAGS
jgi:hypothetical protein